MIDPDKPEEKPVAMKHNFGLSIQLYPVTCPCCGTKVPVNQTVYPKIYPIGKTKASMSGKKKKTEKATTPTIQQSESY